MTFFDRFTAEHLIGAHRGFRACRPENTLSAFKASLGRCHFIEIDVGGGDGGWVISSSFLRQP